MKKKISIKNSQAISLEMHGKFNLDIIKSNGFIGVEFDVNRNHQCDAVLKGDNCIVLVANKDEQKWNEDVKESIFNLKFKGGLLKFIESARPLINHLMSKKESPAIDVTLYVGKDTLNYLKINADNIDLKINALQSKELSLSVDNISLYCESSVSVDKCLINADNVDAEVYFSKRTPFWNVESDNASFKINRQGGFKGQIDIEGDNVDVKGRTSGDSGVGVFRIEGDNVDVRVV